jgi:hypothetical protein
LMSPCLVSLVLWSIRTIIECTIERKKWCNDAIKIQTPKSR